MTALALPPPTVRSTRTTSSPPTAWPSSRVDDVDSPTSRPRVALMTPEELLIRPDSEHCELIAGQLVEKTASMECSWVGGEVLVVIGNVTREHDLGWVFGSDLGYRCFEWDRNMIRRPNVSFVSKAKLPERRFAGGYCEIVPDLVVEVVSTHDTVGEVEAKIEAYLRAGVKVLWVIHPQTRVVEVFRHNGELRRLHEQDSLSDEELFPGFQHPIMDLLPLPSLPEAMTDNAATDLASMES